MLRNVSSTAHRSNTLSRWNCGSLAVCSGGTEQGSLFLESSANYKEVYLYHGFASGRRSLCPDPSVGEASCRWKYTSVSDGWISQFPGKESSATAPRTRHIKLLFDWVIEAEYVL